MRMFDIDICLGCPRFKDNGQEKSCDMGRVVEKDMEYCLRRIVSGEVREYPLPYYCIRQFEYDFLKCNPNWRECL